MNEPVSPAEAREALQKAIPAFVIEAFNQAITANLQGTVARFRVDQVVPLIVAEAARQGASITADDVYRSRWLEVQPRFRQHWDVQFDRPGFNESYPATFTFRERR